MTSGQASYPPSAWRGSAGHYGGRAGGSPSVKPGSVFGRIGREVAEHPAETAALLTMALALSRLLPRSRAGKRGRVSRGVLPLGVMAALCILGLSA